MWEISNSFHYYYAVCTRQVHVVCSQQQIYVASVNNIWRLMCTPVTMQIKQLLACKEFELALHLAVSCSCNTFVSVPLLVSAEITKPAGFTQVTESS